MSNGPFSVQELYRIRDFFPKGCDFYWSPADNIPVPMGTQLVYDEYKELGMKEACKSCTARSCTVRLAPNPRLEKKT